MSEWISVEDRLPKDMQEVDILQSIQQFTHEELERHTDVIYYANEEEYCWKITDTDVGFPPSLSVPYWKPKESE